MATKILGVGLIGNGYWGGILAQCLNGRNDFELLHIADSKYLLDQICNDSRVDLVIIATPNRTHYQLTMEFLRAGKHVLVEKPMCFSASEVEAITELSRQNNLHVITDYTQTFSPSLQFIASGKTGIGEIRAFDLSVAKLGQLSEDQNIYWLMVPHLFSILDMFGSIDKFTFHPLTLRCDMGVPSNVLITFSNGYLRSTLDNPKRGYEITLYGQEGVVSYYSASKPSLRASYYTRPTTDCTNKTWHFREDNNLQHMLTYVHNVLSGNADSNFEMSARVTMAVENIVSH